MHFKELYVLPGIPGIPSGFIKKINQVLRRLKFPYEFNVIPDGRVHMHTMEQRMNFHLLAACNLDYEVPGAWVELGCYTGQSAMVFQKLLDKKGKDQKIVLFDNFRAKYALTTDIKKNLIDNFVKNGLSKPQLVEGNFFETVPSQLPAELAFVHIDCGIGDDPEKHREIIVYLLEHVYPRLSKGGVILFMDYHDPNETINGLPINIGVKLACDNFFKDKSETVYTLYGNNYSHGYIIKKEG